MKDLILNALDRLGGDDYKRAKHVFSKYTSSQMALPYGASGKTAQQILDEYEARDKEIQEAIAWVNKTLK